MKLHTVSMLCVLVLTIVLMSCQSKPKVIEGEPLVAGGEVNTFDSPMPSENQVGTPGDQQEQEQEREHRVQVKEFLHTDRYTYLHVTEHQDSFWIAVPRRAAAVGESYYYRGGLRTHNFHSKEFDRVFETIFLVSEVVLLDNNGSPAVKSAEPEPGTAASEVKLSDLYADPHQYEGKKIRVRGTCVKVNPMILNRNWVHIQDGSGDMELTVTTAEDITVGSVVSLEGIIALDKDFGAGYHYDIILERAVLK